MNLVFLHGLGAARGVWSPVLERIEWDGATLALDLPGHGAARWTGDYTIEGMASDLGARIAQQVDGPVMIVGHSLGGAIGVALGSQSFGCDVEAVVALGVKTTWLDEEVAGLAAVAAKGIRWVETEADALTRFVRGAGLPAESASDAALCIDAVVFDESNGWRTAQDPATFAQQPLDMAALLAGATCPVVLGAGADDAMVPAEDVRRFVDDPRIAPDAGHNVQVDQPAWVLSLINEVAAGL